MNRKTKKLLGLGSAAVLIWYAFNKHQQSQAAAAALAATNAARTAAGQSPLPLVSQ